MKNYYHAPELDRVQRLLNMVYVRNHLIEEIEQLEKADWNANIYDGDQFVSQLSRTELDLIIQSRMEQLTEVQLELRTYEDSLKASGYNELEFNRKIGM